MCVYKHVGRYIEKKYSMSVQWYICAPTFSIRPELLAAEGEKKKKICQDA